MAGSPDEGAAPAFGPVELIALAFPGDDVPGPVLAEVAALAGSDRVRVVDVVVVRPDDDGIEIVEVADLDGPAADGLADLADLADLVGRGLAGEHDLGLVAESLPPGASALVIVVEHLWAAALAAAAREAGAVVAHAELVPAEVVNALAAS
ncbi:DUF6325 family protein [Cellulomonas sp. Y8]|uniref:DUF6325 family protein n=1 Tax=Cellulomonas sp. Y8 TaxID=2591145 RepID=UPI0011CCB443|nr:DUF6325 family protein [Cellulomonas sp. Y8]